MMRSAPAMLRRIRLSVQRCETPQVSVCFCRCDPPLKRDTARARHRAGSRSSGLRRIHCEGATAARCFQWQYDAGRGSVATPAGTRSWTDRSGTICDTDATTATGGGRSLRAGLFLPAPLGFLPTPWWLAPDSHQARCHHGHCLRFERCANPAGSRTGVGRCSDEDASPG